MPKIFLSPSLQTGNPYLSGGTEAQYMGYVADALEPYLTANGIEYTRSRLPNTLGNAIRQSNAGTYDLHLALHSNAAPDNLKGKLRGIQGYYYPTSVKGKQAAQDLCNALKVIYPEKDLVYTVPTTTIAEVKRTKAPAVLMEIGYHDNAQDEAWIKENIQAIAEALAKGLCTYFKITFKNVCEESTGKLNPTVKSGYIIACANGNLNIRSSPNTSSDIVGVIPSGQRALLISPVENGWAEIRYNADEGYASAQYLCSCGNGGNVKYGIVDTEGSALNIRSMPNLQASIIARVPDNTQVEIISNENNWYKIKYSGAEGYVLGSFIKE